MESIKIMISSLFSNDIYNNINEYYTYLNNNVNQNIQYILSSVNSYINTSNKKYIIMYNNRYNDDEYNNDDGENCNSYIDYVEYIENIDK